MDARRSDGDTSIPEGYDITQSDGPDLQAGDDLDTGAIVGGPDAAGDRGDGDTDPETGEPLGDLS